MNKKASTILVLMMSVVIVVTSLNYLPARWFHKESIFNYIAPVGSYNDFEPGSRLFIKYNMHKVWIYDYFNFKNGKVEKLQYNQVTLRLKNLDKSETISVSYLPPQYGVKSVLVEFPNRIMTSGFADFTPVGSKGSSFIMSYFQAWTPSADFGNKLDGYYWVSIDNHAKIADSEKLPIVFDSNYSPPINVDPNGSKIAVFRIDTLEIFDLATRTTEAYALNFFPILSQYKQSNTGNKVIEPAFVWLNSDELLLKISEFNPYTNLRRLVGVVKINCKLHQLEKTISADKAIASDDQMWATEINNQEISLFNLNSSDKKTYSVSSYNFRDDQDIFVSPDGSYIAVCDYESRPDENNRNLIFLNTRTNESKTVSTLAEKTIMKKVQLKLNGFLDDNRVVVSYKTSYTDQNYYVLDLTKLMP